MPEEFSPETFEKFFLSEAQEPEPEPKAESQMEESESLEAKAGATTTSEASETPAQEAEGEPQIAALTARLDEMAKQNALLLQLINADKSSQYKESEPVEFDPTPTDEEFQKAVVEGDKKAFAAYMQRVLGLTR